MLILLAAGALAAPVPLVLDPATAADPDAVDAALEAAVGRLPPGAAGVSVMVRDRDGAVRPLLREVPRVPEREPWAARRPRVAPVDLPGAAEGALSGKAVYLSQCHGWLWYDSLDAFSTQRPLLYDTVEDFHNPEGMDQFLARYLENAGARVYTVKERDLQEHAAVVDDGDPGYAEEGAGFEDGEPGFSDAGPWDYGDNPFDSGTTRRFPAAGGGVARWQPDIPVDGEYAVYVSWDAAADRAPDAHYRITHPGGVIDRRFDQTVHGSTWQYVETLWLPAGPSLTVELIGDSDCADCTLSADAVRVGGGMLDVRRHGEVPDRPRWEGAAVYHVQFNGAPTSVYDPYEDGHGSDPSSRSRWAAWEHPAGEDAVYVSWHSNAGGGTGTATYTYDGSSYAKVEGSDELGDLLQDEIVNAVRALWDGDWTDRGRQEAAFSELNPGHDDEMPAALVELAFHDDPDDVALLKDPAFRRDAARAMARAVVRYFAEKDGVEPRFQPEPPVALAVRHDADGRLRVTWEPGPAGDPYGDAAEDYVLQTSADGRAWDGGTVVDGTEAVLDAAPGEAVYVRVAARNAGGLSFPSEVVGGRRSSEGWTPVLVVPAFDRFEASLLPWEDVEGLGEVVRFRAPRVNPRDIAATVGRSVDAAGYPFDTASDEAFDELVASGELDRYGLVIWLAGEESSHDDAMSPAQRDALRAFVEGGGALFASGAEILWDLDEKGDADDQAFCEEVLGARLAADDAGTTVAEGAGLLDGVPLDFSELEGVTGGGAPYPVEYPDVLASDREVIATYAGGDPAGVIGEGVALLGFPFECVGDEAARAEAAARLLPALLPDYVPPEDEALDTGTPDTGATDTGGAGGVGVTPPGRYEEPGGCGCATGRAAPWRPLALLALLIPLWRRRP